MRRGKLDNISIIYIIIAAIFAVISFSLDQMVIQTEDKIRKKNVMYQKAMFDFHQHTDMGLSFRALQNLIHEEAEFLSFKNEFYLNVLGGFILRPDYYKENFYLKSQTEEINIKHKKQLVSNYKTAYLLLYYDYLDQLKGATKKLHSISFNDPKLNSLHLKVKKVFEVNLHTHYNFLDKTNPENLNVESMDKMYLNLRELDDLFSEADDKAGPIIDILIKKFGENWFTASDISGELAVLKKYKNYFILHSVLSQIAGLLFLLLLFRSILIKLK